MEEYNIADHNTVFLEARKKEIMHEILLMIDDSHWKEKMFYDLQYGLLDMPDDHLSDDDIGPFFRDLMEVKQYVTAEYREYSARTHHYEQIHQAVKELEVLPEGHAVSYKKKEQAYFDARDAEEKNKRGNLCK